jgi:hypothetical protein
MNDTTKELITYYQERVAALEAALKAAQDERDSAKAELNDMIERSTLLYHQTQRALFI